MHLNDARPSKQRRGVSELRLAGPLWTNLSDRTEALEN